MGARQPGIGPGETSKGYPRERGSPALPRDGPRPRLRSQGGAAPSRGTQAKPEEAHRGEAKTKRKSERTRERKREREVTP